jgi:ABC-type sugar transport system permease subunit
MPVVVATGIIAKAELNNYMLTSLGSVSSIDMGGGQTTSDAIMQLSGIQTFLQGLSFNPKITAYITGAVQNIYNIVNLSGVQILLFLSGLQSISPSIYESAKVEGATGWQSLWKITLPMLSPIIFVNTIYTIIDSFTRADNPIMDAIYSTGFKNSQYGIASAMAWVYMIVVMVIVAVIAAIMSRMIYYEKRE